MAEILPGFLQESYHKLKDKIKSRLLEFKSVKPEEYFYELCFCICTPQSKAKNAYEVQKKLMARDFKNTPFDPTPILRDNEHYIRFHNQKAQRLLNAREGFGRIFELLRSELSPQGKRMWFVENFNGFGMKESSHFLRNIGYRELAILDRHTLKHLTYCGVYHEIPKVNSIKQYLMVETEFKNYAKSVDIPIDELDLLFWSYETGEILK
ncbi:MAG: N-glycosylase/DNA lyase [Bacteroidota bacterium]